MDTCTADSNFSAALLYTLKQLRDQICLLKKSISCPVKLCMMKKCLPVVTNYLVLERSSLCFQVCSFIMDYKLDLVGTQNNCSVLIISILVALMIDQVQSLK